MNYTQNCKITQVTETTLVVGVDIGSQWHYARAFDWRGIELTRKVFRFSNDLDGYIAFEEWVQNVSAKSAKMDILIGCEPTGHYWFTFAKYVKERGMKLAFVNPYHVKQSKEMDDNSPRKTNQKDPKTIAKLVTEGRYLFPYIPEDIYFPVEEAIDTIRHEYAHYMDFVLNGKLGHSTSWKQCCIHIGALPIRLYSEDRADYYRKKHEKERQENVKLSQLSPGTIIEHPCFGHGVVLSSTGFDNSRILHVAFSTVGQKALSASWVLNNCKSKSIDKER